MGQLWIGKEGKRKEKNLPSFTERRRGGGQVRRASASVGGHGSGRGKEKGEKGERRDLSSI